VILAQLCSQILIISWKATLSKYSFFYIYSNWTVCKRNFKTTVYFYFVSNMKYIENIKQDQDWLYNLYYTILIRTNLIYLTTLQIVDAVIVARILLYFIAHALELFPCFSTRYRWTLLVLYGFLLCRTLNVCDHEVTAVKSEEHLHISNRHFKPKHSHCLFAWES
jgi:hypothetical protein